MQYRIGRRVEYNGVVYIITGVEGPNIVVKRPGSSAKMTLPKELCKPLIAESRVERRPGSTPLRG